MKNTRRSGFMLKSSAAVLCLALIAFSCDQESSDQEVVPTLTTETTLDKYYTFLEEASGVGRGDIAYDKTTDQFTVSHDMIVDRNTLDQYIDTEAPANGRTEQRMHNILLTNAQATNFKYYIQPALTQGWRDAVVGAIAQWNGVGGSKLHLVQVGTQAEANINVFVGAYDAANWVARATLPSGSGKGTLEINPRFNDMAANQKLFAMAHEMGHNIGFWHTDQTTGTIVPGTPATDPNSVMNSFVLPWNGFTNYDLVAVRYMYPAAGGSFTTTIQAENYSAMAGIQVEACTDSGGGSNVGYIETADWLAYNSINIPTSGTYRVEYRVASASGGGRLSLDLNAGTTVLGAVDVPSTSGWQTWTTVSHNVTINAGTYNFGIYAQAGGWNINWFRITKI
jgi:hypothetical protein